MNPEEKRRYDSTRYANRTPEQVEKDKQTAKSYRDKNKEKVKAKAKAANKNMTPEQHLERRRYERELYANRTPEQVEKDKQTAKKFRSNPINKEIAKNHMKAYNKVYSKKLEVKEKAKIYNKKRNQIPKVIAYHKRYTKDNTKKLNQKQRFRNEDNRFEVCLTYSKRHSNSDIPCCRCCGENKDIRFLAIDHIQGRRNLPKNEAGLVADKLILFLKKNNYPEGYQVLCHNCNSAKGHSKDNKCPHEKNRF